MNKTIFGLLAGCLISGAALAQNSMPVMELTAGFHGLRPKLRPTTRIASLA